MADAQDLKSCVPLGAYGFESRPGYFVDFGCDRAHLALPNPEKLPWFSIRFVLF